MAVGIYKPGQGYWTRVLTATAIGLITLAAAAWIWSQMAVVGERLPRTTWAMSLTEVKGSAPAEGQTVTLVGEPERGTRTSPELGTAVVTKWIAAASELQINNVKMTKQPADPGLAKELRIGAGSSATTAIISGRVSGLAAIDPLLLSAGAASIIIVLGFVIAYYLCAMKHASVEFLISTDMEMKKVNWSTRKDIINSTMVVIAAAVILAGALFVVDVAFQQFFKAIGVIAA